MKEKPRRRTGKPGEWMVCCVCINMVVLCVEHIVETDLLRVTTNTVALCLRLFFLFIYWNYLQVPVLGFGHQPGGEGQRQDGGGWPSILWDRQEALYHLRCSRSQELCAQYDRRRITSRPGCAGESRKWAVLLNLPPRKTPESTIVMNSL